MSVSNKLFAVIVLLSLSLSSVESARGSGNRGNGGNGRGNGGKGRGGDDDGCCVGSNPVCARQSDESACLTKLGQSAGGSVPDRNACVWHTDGECDAVGCCVGSVECNSLDWTMCGCDWEEGVECPTPQPTTNPETAPFILLNEKLEFPDADAACMAMYGSHLASIHNQAEFEFAQQLCAEVQGDYCYIGLECVDECGGDWRWEGVEHTPQWRWMDGTDLDYGFDPNKPGWTMGYDNNPWYVDPKRNDETWSSQDNECVVYMSQLGWAGWWAGMCRYDAYPICGPMADGQATLLPTQVASPTPAPTVGCCWSDVDDRAAQRCAEERYLEDCSSGGPSACYWATGDDAADCIASISSSVNSKETAQLRVVGNEPVLSTSATRNVQSMAVIAGAMYLIGVAAMYCHVQSQSNKVETQYFDDDEEEERI